MTEALRAGYRCVDCAAAITPNATVWRCPACGGLLDLDEFTVVAPTAAERDRRPGLWRYLPALPLAPDTPWRRATMGEGATALLPLDPAVPGVLAKVEFTTPTGSFKDRGAAVLLTAAAALGAEQVVADSSGNAGRAIAAYSARLGLECRVFVPASTPPAKVAAVCDLGASVEVVDGDRAAAAHAAQEAVELTGAFYAAHAYQPVFVHGVKTALWEIVEAVGEAPATLVLPVGNGTYVLGCALAAEELVALGRLERRPRIVAVQAAGCAPLAAAYAAGADDLPPAAEPATELAAPTVAAGIAIAAPPRARQVLAAVRRSGGTFVTVDDGAVTEARAWLARRGWLVEATAAAAVAGWRTHVADTADAAGPTVIPLTGAG